MEELGIRRVQILGQRVGRQRAPAEGDDAAPRIRDREHHAVAEAVIGDRHVGAEIGEPAGFHLRLGDALGGQEFLERVAAVGRKAQPERLLRGRGKAALAQIGARLGADRRLQLLLEEIRGELHDVGQRRAFLVALLGLRVALRHRHAGHAGDALDGFRESSCRRARSGSGNGRPTRRSRNSGSGPSCPRSGRTGSSRHGTGSRPNSRRAAYWSSSCPTTRGRRSPRKSARGRGSRRGRVSGKRIGWNSFGPDIGPWQEGATPIARDCPLSTGFADVCSNRSDTSILLPREF